MAQFSNIDLQEVALNGNVVFDETPICPTRCITHREDSGIVRLNGAGNRQRARYYVLFNGNMQIPTGGTVGEISLAIAVDGEALESTRMIVTPAAVEELWNISASTFVDVPCNCCVTVSVKNVSEQPIEVQNSNLFVVRTA